MGLTTTLNVAQAALASASAQSSILSRNISNVNTTGYARRTANVVTAQNGSSSVASVSRATDTALTLKVRQAQSDSAAQSAISDGLTQIQDTLGLASTTNSSTASASATDQSPSTMIANLTSALQTYASQPDTAANGTSAVTAAQSLVTTLNQASASVQTVRSQADSKIASAVQTINSLLTQFQTANNQVVIGTASGADVTDAQDARDSILSQLSTQVGIQTTTTANGGISIFTDSGATLFDQTAHQVSFTPTTTFTLGTSGNQVSVGGVAITGTGAMAVKSGALAGLTNVRDTVATNYQDQLDQMAKSLITEFAEAPTSGSGATLAGLFTNGGSSALPSSTTGLAATIKINASVDPQQGGNATLLRDGDVSGGNSATNPATTNYTYNTSGDAAYSDHLQQLTTSLSSTQSFNSASGGVASGSLSTYAASSVSWLEGSYQTASNAATYKSSVVSTATTALSNSTGVNLDDQMSQMLDIEHAYQASAQLLNTVKAMYTSLISALN